MAGPQCVLCSDVQLHVHVNYELLNLIGGGSPGGIYVCPWACTVYMTLKLRIA